jgi:hypothetical protein
MKGLNSVKKQANEMSKRRNSGDSKFAKELWQGLRNAGDSVTVRFLEQGEDIRAYWMHEYNIGKRFAHARCLDQDEDGDSIGVPCPGCENNLKRTIRGAINVIWRNSPQLKRGEDGRAVKTASGQFLVEGVKDEVAIWVQGVTVFEDLADKDVKYRGLMSRDFTITKKSKGYSIDPVILEEDGNPGDMSDADYALADGRYDLYEHVFKELSYDDLASVLTGNKVSSNGGGVSEADVTQKLEDGSPWNRGQRGTGRGNRFLNN